MTLWWWCAVKLWYHHHHHHVDYIKIMYMRVLRSDDGFQLRLQSDPCDRSQGSGSAWFHAGFPEVCQVCIQSGLQGEHSGEETQPRGCLPESWRLSQWQWVGGLEETTAVPGRLFMIVINCIFRVQRFLSLRPHMGRLKCGLILQVVLKHRFSNTQILGSNYMMLNKGL